MSEQDNLLGHADDNDGIDEYDNQLPRWWLMLFFVCIVWAVGYAVDYHFISKHSQTAAYNAEMAAAEAKWPAPEAGVTAAGDATAGAVVFKTNCASCHLEDLTGKIGPNLIDDEWIHGGSLDDITRTITDGVPAKGMIGWGPILGPQAVADVAAYVKQQGTEAK
jgi:cytochrome c oxidase cbb3-type subunit III